MRIAVDLRTLQVGSSQYRGIGAYLVHILRRIPLDAPEHDFVFVRYPDDDPIASLGLRAGSHEEIVVGRIERRNKLSTLRRSWREAYRDDFGDLEAAGVDVYWQPDFAYGIPDLPGLRVVVTMYDVIPLLMPEAYLPRRRSVLGMRDRGAMTMVRHLLAIETWNRRYRRTVGEVRRADVVLSISETTAADVVRLIGVDPGRIVTIPLGAPEAPWVHGGDPAPPPEVSAVGERPFLLYIGGLDHRRRLDHLVGAFDELRRTGRDMDLVLVGRDLEYLEDLHDLTVARALASSPHGEDIHRLGYVSEPAKEWLFAHATAFVYPSTYEGFGLPVLEAMVNRCPVVTYRNSSLPEVAGDAAVFVDPPGAQPLARAIEDLLDQPGERARLISAGVERADRFSWERCARETFEVLVGEHRALTDAP